MMGYRTSFAGLLADDHATGLNLRSVEIPLIQRDYAQGRTDESTSQIRSDLLDALLDAVFGNEAYSERP